MKKNSKGIETIIRLAYKKWKSSLAKFDGPCPTDEDLACFVDGRLGKNKKGKIVSHLIRCDRCMESVLLAQKIK